MFQSLNTIIINFWMMSIETKLDQVFSSCIFLHASDIRQTNFKVIEQHDCLDRALVYKKPQFLTKHFVC